jgi:hypothetical protein
MQIDPTLGDFFPGIEEDLHGMRAERIPFRRGNAVDMARSLDAFAAEPDGGLVVPQLGTGATIIALAIQYRLPTVCGTGPSKTA